MSINIRPVVSKEYMARQHNRQVSYHKHVVPQVHGQHPNKMRAFGRKKVVYPPFLQSQELLRDSQVRHILGLVLV